MTRSSHVRVRWWIAIVQVVLLLATMALPVAAAPTDSMSGSQLIQLLQSYQIVKGDPTGNLNLDQPITRAEMITIMVRALGAEDEANLYTGLNVFQDAKGHWAEGILNYAGIKRLALGDGAGHVRPQDNITYGEALTLLLRVLGKEPTTGSWPLNVFMEALDLHIAPGGITAGSLNDKAIRGSIFQSLAIAISTVPTDNGKTFLQRYVDTQPPTVTVNPPATSTNNTQIQVTGTARDAVAVTVNGQNAALSGNVWSATVTLQYGENDIQVVATDLAGNQATASAKVTRVQPISRIEITGPSQVSKSSTATYQVTPYDSAGKKLGLDGVTARVEGNIGSFNLQTGVFTASANPGQGQIVVTSGNVSQSISVSVYGMNPNAKSVRIRQINNGRSVSVTQDMVVTVEVDDANGNFLADDVGRTIQLTASGISGVTVTPTMAQTNAGVATFKVHSTTPGNVTLIASSSGLTTDTGTALFATNVHVVLSADPSNVVAASNNTVSRIKASLVNELGQTVANNTNADIRIQLTATGTDGLLTDSFLTIYRGLSTSTASGDDGFYMAGTVGGSASIGGVVTSGQVMTVDPTAVAITAPQVGSAAKWDMIYPPTNLQPNATGYFTIRMADANGNTVPASYAFQLEISTSNNDPKVNGIPQGVAITLGSTGYNPVSDGIAEGAANDGNDVIVRTMGGIATFSISYNRVGQVYVKVVGVPGAMNAYASDGSMGSAVSGNVVASPTFPINFTTQPTAVKLTVDSTALGTDKTAGAVSTVGGQSFKVRAYFTNGTTWVPGTTGYVTISKVSGSSTIEPTVRTASVVDGKAEFTIQSTGIVGVDTYQITAATNPNNSSLANPTSNLVYLNVQNQAPGAPTILSARGMNGDIPGSWYYAAPNDDTLEMEVSPGSYTGWAVINVYAQNYGAPFYTSEAFNFNGSSVRIRIPKASLPTQPSARMQYQVTLKNGAGETSPRVLTPEYVTNATYNTAITLTAARYDRVANKLYLYGNGFYSNYTNPDTVYPNQISITDASLNRTNPGQGTITLGGAVVQSITSGMITLDVTALAGPLSQFTGNDVSLSTTGGWYVQYAGGIANATSGIMLTPMAKIDYVSYDKTNRRLLLEGSGFYTGNLNAATLKVTNGTTDYVLSAAASSRISDSEWSLSIANLPNLITALDGDPSFTLSGADGWFYDATSTTIRESNFSGIRIYDRITVSSVSYDSTAQVLTINGYGFSGWTVTPGLLSITNLGANPAVTLSLDGDWLTDQSSDTQIKIHLTTNPLTGTGHLSGSSLYVTGQAGWMTMTVNSQTRTAAPIPLWILLLPPQP